MPGGNRTGPAGAGPMSGRAMGFCAGFEMPGYADNTGKRGCRGSGRNRGFGRRFAGQCPSGIFPGQMPTAEQELNILKQQAEFMQNSLSQISERIEKIEKDSKK